MTPLDDYPLELRAALTHTRKCVAPMLHTFIGRHGDTMIGCRTCRAGAPITLLEDLANAKPVAYPGRVVGRYSLTCVRCEQTIRFHDGKSRVPLCPSCKGRAK